jgi:hypothetical protein
MSDLGQEPVPDEKPGAELPPSSDEGGLNLCPRCGGSGERDGQRCETCRGTGTVKEAVGGG